MTEIVNSTSKIILVNISLTVWRYFAQFKPYFDLIFDDLDLGQGQILQSNERPRIDPSCDQI